MNTITISKSVSTAVRPSSRVLQTAAMFGLGVDDTRELMLVPPVEVPLPHLSGQRGIVFITGPSGSGKSTILNLIAQSLHREEPTRPGDETVFRHKPFYPHEHSANCGETAGGLVAPAGNAAPARVFEFDRLNPLEDRPLVDVFDWPGMTLSRTMSVLSMAGLGDAFVMLRRPSELSDGQRYRLRLAQVIAETWRHAADDGTPCDAAPADAASGDAAAGDSQAIVILADEFGATLDRLTAQTISRNVRRWLNKPGPPISLIAATTHDDLLEALEPEVLVWKGLGDHIEVVTR